MSFYIFLVGLVLAAIYFGQVFGLMIFCDNCRDFKEAKQYVYLIPLLKISLFVAFIKDCICEKRLGWLPSYIAMGDKSVMILCTIVELLPDLQRERQKQRQRAKVKSMQRAPKVAVWNFAKAVLFETHEDCVAYNMQMM